jgi:hypothetical protein
VIPKFQVRWVINHMVPWTSFEKIYLRLLFNRSSAQKVYFNLIQVIRSIAPALVVTVPCDMAIKTLFLTLQGLCLCSFTSWVIMIGNSCELLWN